MSSTATERVQDQFRTFLLGRGFSERVISDLLANGLDASCMSFGAKLTNAAYQAMAQAWKDRAFTMSFGAQGPVERQFVLENQGHIVSNAVSNGGDYEEAISLLLAHSLITQIGGAQGAYSLVGPAHRFHDGLEGIPIARLHAMAPNVRVSLLMEGSTLYHVVHGEKTTVRIPVNVVESLAEMSDDDLRAERDKLREEPSQIALLKTSYDYAQSLLIGSIIVAANCCGASNARLTEMRFKGVEDSRVEDVAKWCEVYERFMHVREALGL